MSARATRGLLFLALLLVAPTLVLGLGFLGTLPVGAWLVSAAGWRLRGAETAFALIMGVQVLAWAWAWWIVAGRVSRGIRRARQERQAALALAAAVLIAAVGVLPIYGGAAAGPGFAWMSSAYSTYAVVVVDVLGDSFNGGR